MSHEIHQGEIIQGELIDRAMPAMPATPAAAVTLSPAHPFTLSPARVPAAPVTVRVATLADLPAIDALQKKNSRALGFFPRQQMEGYIKGGWVLVAEGAVASGQWSVAREDKRVVSGQWSVASENAGAGLSSHSPLTTDHSSGHSPLATHHSLLGYVASRDRYQKRDEVGVVYQMCVAPEARRMQVAATLMREVFARAAYGCRLFCCWCAQDLKAANAFWASLGFVPLAFRTGGRATKPRSDEATEGNASSPFVAPSLRRSAPSSRIHIFWQKRVREDDQSTPWWFPASTGGGAIREDRIVLPIPPGVKWDDPMPRLLPQARRAIEDKSQGPRDKKQAIPKHQTPNTKQQPDLRQSLAGLSFGAPVESADDRRARRKAKLLEKLKLDPEQIATARELRDRFLEQAVEGRLQLPEPQTKYAITRTLPARESDSTAALPVIEQSKLLAA